MNAGVINLWVEGDISTNRILSRLLNDIRPGLRCDTHLLGEIDWRIVSEGINVFCRVCDPKYVWLPKHLDQQGVDYIFYLDDNFWEIQGDTELARYYQSVPVISALDEFVSRASLVIVNSESLYAFITARFPGLDCRLLPPPFDTTITKEHLNFDAASLSDEEIIVGYAGGYKHEELQLIEQVIRSLSIDYPRLRFEFIGACTSELKGLPAVRWHPGLPDYKAFVEFKVSRKWSIGLAPLWENPFNASKTNNKYREYGGCGIPGVYSNTPPYRQCIRSGENGILVENTVEAWVAAIRTLIETPELRTKIRSNAFRDVNARYSHKAIAPAWAEALLTIPSPAALSAVKRRYFFYLKGLYLQGNSAEADRAAQLKGAGLYAWIAKQWMTSPVTRRRLKLLFWIFLGATQLNINLFILRSCGQ